jgi:hypothetical protein
MKSSTIRLGSALATCTLLVGLTSCGSDHRTDATDSSEEAVLLGSGDDRLPNNTASEVVTFADHVVVAHVVSEEALPVPKEDIDRKEGLILRDVTFEVDQTLWSSPTALPAPKAFDWTAVGWRFKGSVDERSLAGYENAPRFDVGHTYIMALDWAQPDCKADGRWDGLGGSFNMPYEQDTIGVGEFEGRDIAKDAVREEAPEQGVRGSVWGQDLTALTTALGSARQDTALATQMQSAEADC